MKVAIIGSRSLSINNLEEYIPKDASEIVSGGAIGIDTSAKNYALSNNIKFTEFLPNYNKYVKNSSSDFSNLLQLPLIFHFPTPQNVFYHNEFLIVL